ncbi:hypothetical protein GCM10009867_00740 [Pedococcus aerophilus]|uniref:Uncharacterized protein n=1 Tax=Pedococcus aerophilus TaxID=436356 RepID=A0ABN3UCF4_9MICO
MDPWTYALGALADDLPAASDPRPSRRRRYRLLAKARQNDCAVVAVLSFSSDGLFQTHGSYKLEQGQWKFLFGGGGDRDWEDISPLPAGGRATTISASSGGFGFPAWRLIRVAVDGPETAALGHESEPNNGHLIVFD